MPTTVTKTIKPSGGDYTSLAAFEAGEQRDLVTLDQIAVAECYTMTDTTGVTIFGWNTDSTRYIKIYTPTSERHSGTWSGGYALLSYDRDALVIKEAYVYIEGLRIGASEYHCFRIEPVSGISLVDMRSCLLRPIGVNANGIKGSVGTPEASVVNIYNCIIYGFTTGYGISMEMPSSTIANIFNNTVVGCNEGYRSLNGILPSVKNCISQNNTTGFSGSFLSSSGNNISDINDVPGTDPINGYVKFNDLTNPGAPDYRLHNLDRTAKNKGVDISSQFTDDIDGTTRPQGLAWDIGADEQLSSFAVEKAKLTGAKPRTLLEIDTTISGTQYISDQSIYDGINTYEPLVFQWGDINTDTDFGKNDFRYSTINLTLSNKATLGVPAKRLDEMIEVGQEVRIYIWFDFTPSTEKYLIFRGTVTEGILFNSIKISFSVIDIGYYFNAVIGNFLSLTDFPNANPDDVGRMIPIGYGAVKNQVCLNIWLGGVSTLADNVEPSATFLVLNDASRFPSSGTVEIDDVQNITYTGKSGNTLTGVSNVQKSYRKGDAVWENTANTKYVIFNHPVKSISNIRMIPLRSLGKGVNDAIPLYLSDYTVNTNDGGKTTISIANPYAIRRRTEVIEQPITSVTQQPTTSVSQQPVTTVTQQPVPVITQQPVPTVTSQPVPTVTQQPVPTVTQQPVPTVATPAKYKSDSHNHELNQTTFSTVAFFYDSVDVIYLTTIASAYNYNRFADGSFGEWGSIVGYNTFKFKIYKAGVQTYQGTPTSIRYKIKCATSHTGPSNTTIKANYYINGIGRALDTITMVKAPAVPIGSIGPVTVFTSLDYGVSGVTWEDLADGTKSYIEIINDSNIGTYGVLIWEVWQEVTYSTPLVTPVISEDVPIVINNSDVIVNNSNVVVNNSNVAVSNSDVLIASSEVRLANSNVVLSNTNVALGNTNARISGEIAASILGGYLIVDAEGYQDDGTGHYTGTPNALIEKPWHVIHHLIENHSNYAGDNDIDLSGTFADAEANLSSSFIFQFAIRKRIELNKLLALLAPQTWCRICVDKGMYKLIRNKKISDSAIKTINSDNDSFLIDNLTGVSSVLTEMDKIKNKIEVRYGLDYTIGYWDNPDAYANDPSKSVNSASITKFGERVLSLLFFAIKNDSTLADLLSARYKDTLSVQRKLVEMPLLLSNLDIQREGKYNITSPQLGLSSHPMEIMDIDYFASNPIAGKVMKVWAKFIDMVSYT